MSWMAFVQLEARFDRPGRASRAWLCLLLEKTPCRFMPKDVNMALRFLWR